MSDDAQGYRKRFLCRVIDFFIRKPAAGKRGKIPDVSSHPSFWMGCPGLTIFHGDAMLDPFLAFVRLADGVINILFSFGEPENWLVVSVERPLAVSCEPIFVVPDDLAPITKTEFVHN